MHRIIEFVYLGGLADAMNGTLLERERISAILACCMPFELPPGSQPKGLDYMTVEVEDMGAEPISLFFASAAEFIEAHIARKEGVLIHCKSGVSRSATITIAYLVLMKNFYLQEAFFHVRTKRNIICPNVGFMRQLCELEIAVLGSRRSSFQSPRKVSDDRPDVSRRSNFPRYQSAVSSCSSSDSWNHRTSHRGRSASHKVNPSARENSQADLSTHMDSYESSDRRDSIGRDSSSDDESTTHVQECGPLNGPSSDCPSSFARPNFDTFQSDFACRAKVSKESMTRDKCRTKVKESSRRCLPPVPSICMDKYLDWYMADISYRPAVPDLDP